MQIYTSKFKNLSNKYAVVTGGEGGIGKAIVKFLVSDLFKVICLDSKIEDDITNIPSVIKVLEPFTKIDLLVNCAGITHCGWDKTIDVNLKAPYELSRIVLPKMKERGGNIINITSLWSERGFEGNVQYGASKGGLKMITKCLAVEWAKYNIRVNNIGLGYFKTDMTAFSWKNRRKKITNKIPLGRWGEPEDIKEAIRFLINCRYVTGQDIYLDGGWLANGF